MSFMVILCMLNLGQKVSGVHMPPCPMQVMRLSVRVSVCLCMSVCVCVCLCRCMKVNGCTIDHMVPVHTPGPVMRKPPSKESFKMVCELEPVLKLCLVALVEVRSHSHTHTYTHIHTHAHIHTHISDLRPQTSDLPIAGSDDSEQLC